MSGQATGWVLRHGPKNHAMRAVLITIADAANRDGEHSYPGIQAIIEGSLYARRSVFRILRMLVDDEWLVVEQAGGGRGKATVYGIPGVLGKGCHGDTVPAGKGCHPERETVPSERETVPRRLPDQPVPGPNGTTNVSTNNNARESADAFDAFWLAYPRRVDKGTAQRAWTRATRKAEACRIIAAARAYAEDPARKPEFTKYPATWLNAEAWGNGAEHDDEAARHEADQQVLRYSGWGADP